MLVERRAGAAGWAGGGKTENLTPAVAPFLLGAPALPQGEGENLEMD